MHQAAALPQGSPQECNPAQGTAAGLRRPEGQGWHQRVHILYTLVHIHEYGHTHVSLFLDHVTLDLYPLLFVMSALGFL